MSKKTNRPAAPAKHPAPPSAENPGGADELPAEVTHPRAAQSPRERARELEESEILKIFKTELGGGGFITFQRRHPPSGQTQYSHLGGSMPVDSFSIANVATIYGGGDYIAKARSSAGQFAQEVRFSVDHSITPKNPMASQADKTPAAPPVDIAAIIREIRASQPPPQNNSEIVELAKAAMARPEPKGETAAVIEMIKEIREDARKAEDRFFKILEKMNERNAPPPAPSLREQLEEARELLDLLGGDRGPDKGDSFWKDLGRGAAEALGPLIKNHFAGAAPALMGALPSAGVPVAVTAAPASFPPHPDPQPAAAVNGHAGEPAHTETAAAAAPADMNISMQFFLTQFRKQALDAGRRGKDAFDFVDTVIGLVPAEMLPKVFGLAQSDNWFASIFGTEPEAMKHLAFLTKLRAAVLLKAFVLHAQYFAAVKKPAEETARAFLAWAPREFDDELFATTDAENWALAFEGVALDPAWLEQLRAAVSVALDPPEPEETPEPAAAAEEKKAGAFAKSAKAAK